MASPVQTQPTQDVELPPPFITVPGLYNFRDIGGWPVSNLNTGIAKTRSRILYRGSDVYTIIDAGTQKLKDIGVEVIFDLRSVAQIKRAGGVRELEGIKRIWVPVFTEEQYSPEKAGARYAQYSSDGTEGIVQAFKEILQCGANPAFRTLLLHLASLPPAPSNPPACMIHCTTGNNRSGVFIGILLSLAGVSPADIAVEYSLSTQGLELKRESVVNRLLKNPKFAEAVGTGEEGRRRAERMVGAREESMLAMLEMVESSWGNPAEGVTGAEGFVLNVVGLTKEELEKVKENLVQRV